MSNRILKINSLIKRELSLIIQQELKDPRVGFVTVTSVETTSDLQHAKVFCSVMGDVSQKETSIKALNKARGYIQSELASRIQIKFLPQLHFKLDATLDYSMKIEEIIKKIHEERTQTENTEGAEQ